MKNELCIFGEVLFDLFPDGQSVLGGAPFNVAWHLQAFGQAPRFFSRVGNDPAGIQVRKAMLDWGMDTLTLQTDSDLPTGQVTVTLQDGEPEYDIVNPAAYDAIEPDTTHTTACDFLYHGSLALRNAKSRQALMQIKSGRPTTIFVDVNLRDPWWDRESVTRQLVTADWVKLNAAELRQLHASDETGEKRLAGFIDKYQLQGLILTHGAAGAEVKTVDGGHYTIEPSSVSDMIDAVGAGDAFSSVVILGLREGWPVPTTIQRAQAFASAIVGKRGATVSDRSFYQDFMNSWNIA